MMLFLIMISLIMLSSLVLADYDYNIQFKPIKNTIFPNQSALFEVEIENTGTLDDVYRIYYPDVLWDIKEENIRVEAGDIFSYTLEARPSNVGFGYKGIPINIRSKNLTYLDQVFLFVRVKSYDEPDKKEYVPTVMSRPEIPEKVNPKETLSVPVVLENRNPLNIERLTISLESENGLFREAGVLHLGPLETQSYRFEISLDPYTPPQEDAMILILKIGNETIRYKKYDYEISALAVPYNESASKEVKLFKIINTYTIENSGNLVQNRTVLKKISFWNNLFTKTKPEAEVIKQNNTRYLAWTLQLKPDQTVEIISITNYRPLISLLMILLLVGGLYYWMKPEIVLVKRTRVLKTYEGGSSVVKVSLDLKNTSKYPLKQVEVSDKVPRVAEYMKEEVIGTAMPSKVLRHEKRGTLLKWEFPIIEPYEERIISYKIQTKIGVIGKIKFSQAYVKYRNKANREVVVKSKILEEGKEE